MKRKHYYEYFILMQNQVCSSDGKISYLFAATARPLKPGFHDCLDHPDRLSHFKKFGDDLNDCDDC